MCCVSEASSVWFPRVGKLSSVHRVVVKSPSTERIIVEVIPDEIMSRYGVSDVIVNR